MARRWSSGRVASAERTRSAVTSAIAISSTSGRRLGPSSVLDRAATARRLAADVIDGPAVGECAEPRAKRSPVGIERVGPLPESDEHILGDVLGGAGVAGDPQREPVDERCELVIDLVESAFLAGDQPVPRGALPLARTDVPARLPSDVLGHAPAPHARYFVTTRSRGSARFGRGGRPGTPSSTARRRTNRS